MKKFVLSLVAIAATLSFFSSCDKEQTTPSEKPSGPKTYTLTITATKASSTKSFDYTESTNTLSTVWDGDEVVEVWYGNPTKVKVGDLHPVSKGSSTTTLSGTVTADLAKGEYIDLWCGGGLNNQDGTLETLTANNSDRTKAWFAIDDFSETTITPDRDVIFYNAQAIVKFTVKSGENLLPVSKMIITATTGNLEGGDGKVLTINPSEATSELWVAIENQYADYNADDTAVDNYEIRVLASGGWYSVSKSEKKFIKGHYYNVTLKVSSLIRTAAGFPASVFGSEWTASATSNDLSYDSETGNYKVALTVPGNVNYLKFKVGADHSLDTAWPAADYEVSGISANGFSKTLTIIYNPINNAVNHTLVQNESPYKMYVKDEKLATATKWGSSRSIWCGYDFIQEADVDGYKCFAIPHAIVDGSAHDLYYKGANNCEVKLSFTPSTSTNAYYFKTDGFEIVPTTESYTSEKRVWVQTNLTTIYAHMWQNTNTKNSTDWDTCQMSTNYAKYDGKYWYYATINTGWDKLILSWAARTEYENNADGPQRVHYDISNSQNYYYYVTYNSDSAYWYGTLFSSDWE